MDLGKLRRTGDSIVVLLVAAVILVGPASALPPDWSMLAQEETIEALTHDADGESRQTTIWLVDLDGSAYIRTSQSSRWGADVVRAPDIALRIGEQEIPVRANFIIDEDLRQKVTQAFRNKYGMEDAVIGIIRGRNPHIMNVVAR